MSNMKRLVEENMSNNIIHQTNELTYMSVGDWLVTLEVGEWGLEIHVRDSQGFPVSLHVACKEGNVVAGLVSLRQRT